MGGIRGILNKCQIKREFYARGQSEATYGYIKNMLENEKLRYSIDPSGSDIIIEVTGIAATTIQWQAIVEMNIVGA